MAGITPLIVHCGGCNAELEFEPAQLEPFNPYDPTAGWLARCFTCAYPNRVTNYREDHLRIETERTNAIENVKNANKAQFHPQAAPQAGSAYDYFEDLSKIASGTLHTYELTAAGRENPEQRRE